MRPGSSRRSRRGTKGGGFRQWRLKKSGRLPRAISSVSRKPSVATSPTVTPLRSASALITTAVPWARKPAVARSTSAFCSARSMPRPQSGGVVAVLAVRIVEGPVSGSRVKSTRPAKVPPTSVAARAIRLRSVILASPLDRGGRHIAGESCAPRPSRSRGGKTPDPRRLAARRAPGTCSTGGCTEGLSRPEAGNRGPGREHGIVMVPPSA